MHSHKTPMKFIEGTSNVYRPIRMLFGTLIFEQAMQICWHISPYKSQVALLAELLRLQQNQQLSSDVAAEDMAKLLVGQSKGTLKVKHPKIISRAEKYARSLTEQQRQTTGSKLLRPQEVMMEVEQKVLQVYWLPPPCTSFSLPSQQLSKMAVGLTQAVQDQVSAALSSMRLQITFSCPIRHDVVLSIQEKGGQVYTENLLVEKLNCFEAEPLNTITGVAAGEIRVLFQPQNQTEADSTVALSPPVTPSDEAPAITAVQTVPALLFIPSETQETFSDRFDSVFTDPTSCDALNAPAEQPTPHFEPSCSVASAPPFPVTSSFDAAPLLCHIEPAQQPKPISEIDNGVVPSWTSPPKSASVFHGEDVCGEPSRHSVVVSAPPADNTTSDEAPVTTTKQDALTVSQHKTKAKTVGELYSFFNRLFCCFVLPEDDV